MKYGDNYLYTFTYFQYKQNYAKKIPTLNAGKSETYLRIKIEVLLVRGDHYLFKIHCLLTILCYFKKNLRLLKEKEA